MIANFTDIKETTTQLIVNILPDVTANDLQEESEIFNLGLDSINAMTLVCNLQDTFDIQLDPNEINFENFQNIATIVAMVKDKKGV